MVKCIKEFGYYRFGGIVVRLQPTITPQDSDQVVCTYPKDSDISNCLYNSDIKMKSNDCQLNDWAYNSDVKISGGSGDFDNKICPLSEIS